MRKRKGRRLARGAPAPSSPRLLKDFWGRNFLIAEHGKGEPPAPRGARPYFQSSANISFGEKERAAPCSRGARPSSPRRLKIVWSGKYFCRRAWEGRAAGTERRAPLFFSSVVPLPLIFFVAEHGEGEPPAPGGGRPSFSPAVPLRLIFFVAEHGEGEPPASGGGRPSFSPVTP